MAKRKTTNELQLLDRELAIAVVQDVPDLLKLGDLDLDSEVVLTVQGQLLALARFEAGQLQPFRVFNL